MDFSAAMWSTALCSSFSLSNYVNYGIGLQLYVALFSLSNYVNYGIGLQLYVALFSLSNYVNYGILGL